MQDKKIIVLWNDIYTIFIKIIQCQIDVNGLTYTEYFNNNLCSLLKIFKQYTLNDKTKLNKYYEIEFKLKILFPFIMSQKSSFEGENNITKLIEYFDSILINVNISKKHDQSIKNFISNFKVNESKNNTLLVSASINKIKMDFKNNQNKLFKSKFVSKLNLLQFNNIMQLIVSILSLIICIIGFFFKNTSIILLIVISLFSSLSIISNILKLRKNYKTKTNIVIVKSEIKADKIIANKRIYLENGMALFLLTSVLIYWLSSCNWHISSDVYVLFILYLLFISALFIVCICWWLILEVIKNYKNYNYQYLSQLYEKYYTTYYNAESYLNIDYGL